MRRGALDFGRTISGRHLHPLLAHASHLLISMQLHPQPAGLCDVLALFVVLCVHRPNLSLGRLR